MNDRIQKFTSTGTFITKWGSSGIGPSKFTNPIEVAVDSEDNVYVVDNKGAKDIQKFASDGTFILSWGSFSEPQGIAIDSKDNVYVADGGGNNNIQKFDSNGKFITKWGSFGSGDGQFGGPRDVAIDPSDNVYVIEFGNNRVQKFDSSGNFITKWGSKGSSDGQFNAPHGIAVDSAGNVYVLDTFNNRVQKFDNKGNFITKWGSQGSDDGQFKLPVGIAVDSVGNVYVSDQSNHRIQVFVLTEKLDVAKQPIPKEQPPTKEKSSSFSLKPGNMFKFITRMSSPEGAKKITITYIVDEIKEDKLKVKAITQEGGSAKESSEWGSISEVKMIMPSQLVTDLLNGKTVEWTSEETSMKISLRYDRDEVIKSDFGTVKMHRFDGRMSTLEFPNNVAVWIHTTTHIIMAIDAKMWLDKTTKYGTIDFRLVETNVDLTNTDILSLSNLSNTSTISGQPQAAVSGNKVYVVWTDEGLLEGDRDVFFRASNDGGATFSPVINLSNSGSAFYVSSIASSGDNVYVVWIDSNGKDLCHICDILFKASTDGGASFGSVVKLGESGELVGAHRLSVFASDNNVYVAWLGEGNGLTDIFFRASNDRGATFGPVINLSDNEGMNFFPRLTASGDNVYVTWTDSSTDDPNTAHPSEDDIFLRKSGNKGATFDPVINVSNIFGWSRNQRIVASGDDVYMVWQEETVGRSGHFTEDIIFKKSKDNGENFGKPIKLTDSDKSSLVPDIAVSGKDVYVVWEENDTWKRTTDILFRKSADGGTTFDHPITLVTGFEYELESFPRIETSDDKIYVIWVGLGFWEEGENDIFLRASHDKGTTFGPLINLSNSPGREFSPQLQVTDNSAYVVWRGSDASNPEIMFWSEKGKVEAVPEVPRPEVLKQAKPIIPVEQPDITVNMKQKKKSTLVAIKNNDEEPVYGIQIKLDDGKIRFAKARGWDRERVDESTVILKSLERSLGKGGSLILLLIGDKQNPSFEWSVLDRFDNLFGSGRVGAPLVVPEMPKWFSKELAEEFLPTLKFGSKEKAFPASFTYDDEDIEDNYEAYNPYTIDFRQRPTVYVNAVEKDEQRFIQYWYYYAFNDFTPINRHEHDWEWAWIEIDAKNNPVRVYHSGHGETNVYDWQELYEKYDLERDDGHPILYVETGSHSFITPQSELYYLHVKQNGIMIQYDGTISKNDGRLKFLVSDTLPWILLTPSDMVKYLNNAKYQKFFFGEDNDDFGYDPRDPLKNIQHDDRVCKPAPWMTELWKSASLEKYPDSC